MFSKNGKVVLLSIILMLTTIATAISFLNLNMQVAKAAPDATYYLDPSTLTNLKIGDTFNIVIKFKDFTQLWMWQAGLQFDPAILECTDVLTFKPMYPESVFAVLAPTRGTVFIDGTIDNAAGKIYPPYAESLKAPGEGVTGTPGTGYNIMNITMRVKGYAPEGSNITIIETLWTAYPDYGTTLPHNLINATIYTITPPTPKSPVANFTWNPAQPSIGQNVTFDASSSTSGFNGTATIPITEYRWDFNGDLVWDKIANTSKASYLYGLAGDYNVTLEVYAPDSYPPEVPDTDTVTKTVTINTPPPPPLAQTFVYVDPPRINATTIGQSVTVYIKIKDFAQLWGWQAGLQWDPTLLNCTEVLAGPTFPEGVFNVLAPGRFTIIVDGTINNTAGQIYPPYSESLTVPGVGVDSIPGEVYNLMKITFKVKATGIIDLHLRALAIYYRFPEYPYYLEGEAFIRDIFTVTLSQGDFPIEIVTNSTGDSQRFSNEAFTFPQNKTSFVITSKGLEPHVYGFCNVTIPRALMWDGIGDWIVKVNGAIVTPEIKVNSTSTFLHFTYPHKTDGEPGTPKDNLIEIISPHAIPEFSTQWLLMALLIAMLMLAILSKTKLTWLKQRRTL